MFAACGLTVSVLIYQVYLSSRIATEETRSFLGLLSQVETRCGGPPSASSHKTSVPSDQGLVIGDRRPDPPSIMLKSFRGSMHRISVHSFIQAGRSTRDAAIEDSIGLDYLYVRPRSSCVFDTAFLANAVHQASPSIYVCMYVRGSSRV